jgi:threonine aldolase
VIAKTTGSPAAPEIVEKLAEAGVLCASLDDRTVRFVTHLDVDSEAVDAAISAAEPVLS